MHADGLGDVEDRGFGTSGALAHVGCGFFRREEIRGLPAAAGTL
jgi:hypothetical protein